MGVEETTTPATGGTAGPYTVTIPVDAPTLREAMLCAARIGVAVRDMPGVRVGALAVVPATKRYQIWCDRPLPGEPPRSGRCRQFAGHHRPCAP